MKKYLVPVLFLGLVACNNSGDNKETKDTTAMMDNGHMDHTMPTEGGVPELPAIPDGAKVLFANLKDNEEIKSPFLMQMGTEVMKVDTAGPVVAGSGHHHLIVDGPDFVPAGTIVPKDSLHIHFGKGQTEYELVLPPGKHKLTLQMADGLHRSYGENMAAHINVMVKE